jgi:hypothetical protein
MLFMVGCRVENPDGMTAQEQWRIVEAADARMAEDMMECHLKETYGYFAGARTAYPILTISDLSGNAMWMDPHYQNQHKGK